MMKRPLFIIAISLVIGTLLGEYLNISILLIFFVVVFIGSLIYWKATGNKRIFKIILISILLVSCSFCYVKKQNKKYNDKYREEEIKVLATVCSKIDETEYYYRVTIKVDSPRKYKNTKLLLYVKKNLVKEGDLSFGNQLSLIGEYKEPEVARNYKGFDYKNYLKTKKIFGTMIVKERYSIVKENNYNFLITSINKISDKIKNNFKVLLSQEEQSIVTGILLGDSSDISEPIKENFSKSSVSHILAVSGAHVSYIIMTIGFIFSSKFFGKRLVKEITIIALIFFMIITNMSPSVTRAGVSIIISILATLFYKQPDTINAISISIIFTMLINPFSLFNIGLQLSYAGTIGILAFQKSIKEKCSSIIRNIQDGAIITKIRTYILDNICVSLSANLVSFPLIAFYFNTISLNFILSNIVISPILGIIIMLGIIISFVSCVSIKFAEIVIFPLKISIDLIIKITEIIANLPVTNITVATPKIISIVIFYIILFLTKKKINKKICIALIIPVIFRTI